MTFEQELEALMEKYKIPENVRATIRNNEGVRQIFLNDTARHEACMETAGITDVIRGSGNE